jgi:hypothetical protein
MHWREYAAEYMLANSCGVHSGDSSRLLLQRTAEDLDEDCRQTQSSQLCHEQRTPVSSHYSTIETQFKSRGMGVFEAEQGVRINPRNEQSLKNPR